MHLQGGVYGHGFPNMHTCLQLYVYSYLPFLVKANHFLLLLPFSSVTMWSTDILSRIWLTIQPQKAKISLNRILSRLGSTWKPENQLVVIGVHRTRYSLIYKPYKIFVRIEITIIESYNLVETVEYDLLDLITRQRSQMPTWKEGFSSLKYPARWKSSKLNIFQWNNKKRMGSNFYEATND